MKQLSCGIVGLPNVGKSTLFNALLKKNQAQSANFPFCTIEPNTGIVQVPDSRLEVIGKLSNTQSLVPTTIQFVDIAGLVKGASQGAGLGNQFLSHIRQTDLIIHVVRAFQDDNIIHVDGTVSPIDDIQIIDTELILSDLQMVENSLTKLQKQKRGDEKKEFTYNTLLKIQEHLEKNSPLRTIKLSSEETQAIIQYPFITQKPIIYAANIGENTNLANDPTLQMIVNYSLKTGNICIPFCAKLEAELIQMSDAESREYLSMLGFTQMSLDRLIQTAYKSLNLITFFTTGKKETKAWPIFKNTTAKIGAGTIHSDISNGFIRAEVVSSEELIAAGGLENAKSEGKHRFEGKEYIIQDGDVITFFHN